MKCYILYETMIRLVPLHNMSNNNRGSMQVKMQMGITILIICYTKEDVIRPRVIYVLVVLQQLSGFFVCNIEAAIIVKITLVDRTLAWWSGAYMSFWLSPLLLNQGTVFITGLWRYHICGSGCLACSSYMISKTKLPPRSKLSGWSPMQTHMKDFLCGVGWGVAKNYL
jgi:hypothetical protein